MCRKKDFIRRKHIHISMKKDLYLHEKDLYFYEKISILMKKLGIKRALRWPVGIEQILPVFFQKPAKHLHKTSSYYFFLVG